MRSVLAAASLLLALAVLPVVFHRDGRRGPEAGGCDRPAPGGRVDRSSLVRVRTITYRAHDGRRRPADVVLPRWYGPHDDPPIPLVISDHGRGGEAGRNTDRWGPLPALGRFAVVAPSGEGRRLELCSWGDPGQISDLARMPSIVTHALPWLRVDRRRIYAVGGSMGGQETLLLVAEHPRLLAGAVAFDAPTNLALRYRDFPISLDGRSGRRLARIEVGGTPAHVPDAYADRSPLDFARRIAFSRVPVELWWSTQDRVVVRQSQQSGLLYRRITTLNPRAPVAAYVGAWPHTAEFSSRRDLPIALARLGLLSRRIAAAEETDAHPFPFRVHTREPGGARPAEPGVHAAVERL